MKRLLTLVILLAFAATTHAQITITRGKIGKVAGSGQSVPLDPALSYAGTVRADGATNYYRLNEPSGTTAADSVGGNNGTISGGVTLGQPGPLAGSTAMAFNGTTGNILSAKVIPPIGNGEFTLEIWMNGTVPPASIGILIDTKEGSNARSGYALLVDPTPAIYLWTRSTTSEQPLAASGFALDGRWHHVVGLLARNPDELRLYIDGAMTASTSVTPAGLDFSAAQPVGIGGAVGGIYLLPGLLDEAAIYSRALTPAQIANHYALRFAPEGNFQRTTTYQQLTVSTTAVGLAAATTQGMATCSLTVEANPIRFRIDQPPTAAIGTPIAVGETVTISNIIDARAARFIRSGAADGILNATCWPQ